MGNSLRGYLMEQICMFKYCTVGSSHWKRSYHAVSTLTQEEETVSESLLKGAYYEAISVNTRKYF